MCACIVTFKCLCVNPIPSHPIPCYVEPMCIFILFSHFNSSDLAHLLSIEVTSSVFIRSLDTPTRRSLSSRLLLFSSVLPLSLLSLTQSFFLSLLCDSPHIIYHINIIVFITSTPGSLLRLLSLYLMISYDTTVH